MSQLTKKIKQMRSHPNSIDFVTVDYVLLHLGFEKREGKGSHVIYFKQETGETITIPKRKPIKTCYIQQILKLLDVGDEE